MKGSAMVQNHGTPESLMIAFEFAERLGAGFIWFPVASLAHRLQSVQSRVAEPRESQTGRGPPEYFIKPQQSRGCPSSPGAPGGGRVFFPRGCREEPGSSASKISKGLWAVDLESHIVGLGMGK